MLKSLLDLHNHHGRWFLAVNGEASSEIHIRAYPCAPIHAIRLVCAGDEENQSDARILNKVLETLDLVVAAPVGNEQRASVVRNLDEAGAITLGRTVKTMLASGSENQKRRSSDECAASRINTVKLTFDDALGWGA